MKDDSTFKLYEFFDYFIFSNEKDVAKLTSKEYTPIINNKFLKYDFSLSEYDNKKFENDEIIIKDGVEYCLLEVIPKSYYNFYNKSNKLFFESKYVNQNYMDVWIEKQFLSTKKKQKKTLAYVITIIEISVECFAKN